MSFNVFETTNGLHSWGRNKYGELGLGKALEYVNIPTKLDFFENNELEILFISCGGGHTIINTTDGLYGWGSNHHGQLGLGDIIDQKLPTRLEFFDDLEIIFVYCGAAHTIIHTTDGVYVLGSNHFGELGLGYNIKSVKVPKKLDFFNAKLLEIKSISCGWHHTMVNTRGGLYVFGSNFLGELGLCRDNALEDVHIPTKLTFFDNIDILSVTCGHHYTIINTNDGLYVIGSNRLGQLGLSENIDFVDVPTKLEFFSTTYNPSFRKKNKLEILSISCGDDHTIINTTDGLYGFGSNCVGQLGLGQIVKIVNIPTKLEFFNIKNFDIFEIYCRSMHTIINTSYGLYVFGFNSSGELGLGRAYALENQYTPTKCNFNFEIITNNKNKQIKSARSFY